MDLQANVFHAAKTIHQQCLGLNSDAQYLIFTDETTAETAALLARAGVELGMQPIPLFYPTELQKKLKDSPLPSSLTNSLSDVTAAMICLGAEQQTFTFRDYVRQAMWNEGLKVAHMPGLSPRTILMADVDYAQLSERCRLFALTFAKGKHIEILTRDQRGGEHRLSVPLNPWVRYPIISDGIIDKHSWGNVPSGETYIAPPEGQAEGEIVVNGSIHTFLIPPGEEVLLRFKQGQLVHWEPSRGPAGQYIHSTIASFSAERGDTNWAYLAEVGLGANPQIHTLTGIPLLDEKKYGSVHIALGNNMDMGGQIASSMHYDMVCLSAEVRVDGKTIIRDNQIVLKEEDWREDFRKLTIPRDWSQEMQVRCTVMNAELDSQGRLTRWWDTSSGRVCSVPVGNEKTSLQLGNIYQFLQKNGHHPIHALADQYHTLSTEDFMRALYLLSLYGLVSPQKHN